MGPTRMDHRHGSPSSRRGGDGGGTGPTAREAALKLAGAVDLVSTAFHEAGHAHVARQYGIPSRVELFRTGTKEPASDKLWNGSTRILGDLGSHSRTVALAGPLAVLLGTDPGITPGKALQALQGLQLSDTDRAGAGDFTLDDVAETLSLLRKLWPAIEEEASRLISSTTQPKPLHTKRLEK